MGNAASLDAVRRNAQGVDTEVSKRARSEPTVRARARLEALVAPFGEDDENANATMDETPPTIQGVLRN